MSQPSCHCNLNRLIQRLLVALCELFRQEFLTLLWGWCCWCTSSSALAFAFAFALTASLAKLLAFSGCINGEEGREKAVRHLHGLRHLLLVLQPLKQLLMVALGQVSHQDVSQVSNESHEGKTILVDQFLPSLRGVALFAELGLEGQRLLEPEPLPSPVRIEGPWEPTFCEGLFRFWVPLAQDLHHELMRLGDMAQPDQTLHGQHWALREIHVGVALILVILGSFAVAFASVGFAPRLGAS
mmetsp:Transcript_9731/g.21765  ORF Transcript_9731/g.21765 Transcript_9731/m.21765 type:complete len:241 (-) Transcript_9731:1222-1944(-)